MAIVIEVQFDFGLFTAGPWLKIKPFPLARHGVMVVLLHNYSVRFFDSSI